MWVDGLGSDRQDLAKVFLVLKQARDAAKAIALLTVRLRTA
ncbi:hypothetical protein [Trichocoleus sp. FACHB-262]|nr:hypothetical protein [Trichocoleus sp. FACHB-262]